jgi:hypothetical protein
MAALDVDNVLAFYTTLLKDTDDRCFMRTLLVISPTVQRSAIFPGLQPLGFRKFISQAG